MLKRSLQTFAILLCLLGLAVIPASRPAWAIPSPGALLPADDYADISIRQLARTGVDRKTGEPLTTFEFKVNNIQPPGGCGIKGLVVFCPIKPFSMSSPERCQTTLYETGSNYSWWEYNDTNDKNRNGLPDRYIGPGQWRGDDGTFTMTFRGAAPDLDDFLCAVHVVLPWTLSHNFCHQGRRPFARMDLSVKAGAPCVLNGGSATFTYVLSNTGTETLLMRSVKDAFGDVPGVPLFLLRGCNVTLTRTAKITTSDTSFTNEVNAIGRDYRNGANVSAVGSVKIQVAHPAMTLSLAASPNPAVAYAPVKYTYTAINTGDVAINSIKVTDTTGGVTTTIGTISALAPGARASLTRSVSSLTAKTTSAATAQGTDACTGSTVKAQDSTTVDLVTHPRVNLQLKAGPPVVCPSDPVTVSYTITNSGDVELKNVSISFNDGYVDNLAPLAPNASKSLTRTIQVPANAVGTMAIGATASGKDSLLGGVVTSTSSATVTVQEVHPSISLSITPSATNVLKGSDVVYTYVVTNTGDVIVNGIQVTDTTDGATTTVGTIAALSPQTSATLERTAHGLTKTTTSAASAAGTDACRKSNVQASASTSVRVISPGLLLNVTATPGSAFPSDPVSVGYSVENTGDVDLNGVTVTFADGFTNPVGILQAGDMREFSRTVTVPANASGQFSIDASASAQDAVAGSAVSSNPATAAVTVQEVHPVLSLSLQASPSPVGPNTPVTYTYTVANTGDVTVNNIKVTDTTDGTATDLGTIAALDPGQSSSVTRTADSLTKGTTSAVTAVGTDAARHTTVQAAGSILVSLVTHPSIDFQISASPTVASAGDNVTVSFTVTNSGDVDLNDVSVIFTDGASTDVGNLAVGASRSFNRSVTVPDGGTSFPIVAAVSGMDAIAAADPHAPKGGQVSVSGSTSVDVVPASAIRGAVVCAGHQDVPVGGAVVQLVNSSGVVVATTTASAVDPLDPTAPAGMFSFDRLPDGSHIPDGTYAVRAAARDYTAGSGDPISYNHIGADASTQVALIPLPIVHRSVASLQGRLFFGRGQGAFKDKEAGTLQGPTVPLNDLTGGALGQLTDPQFISPKDSSTNFTKSYKYFGYIPGYPELGYFDHSTTAKSIWVIMETPLVQANVWDDFAASFRNMVYVVDSVIDPTRSGSYTIRILFSQPFEAPAATNGTAYDYAVTGLDITGTPAVIGTPSWARLANVPWTAAANPAPADGSGPANTSVILPGWMAQTQFQFRQVAGQPFLLYADGAFKDVAGGAFSFHIHPEGEPSPNDVD